MDRGIKYRITKNRTKKRDQYNTGIILSRCEREKQISGSACKRARKIYRIQK